MRDLKYDRLTTKARQGLWNDLVKAEEVRSEIAKRARISPGNLCDFIRTGRLGIKRMDMLAKALGGRIIVKYVRTRKG